MAQVQTIFRAHRAAMIFLLLTAAHLLLWMTWAEYRYGFGWRLGDLLMDAILLAMRATQLEQIPQAQAYSMLILGITVAFVAGVVSYLFTKRQR